MYCQKCGKENSDEAVYCQKCGNMFEAEEETRVAVRSGDSPHRISEALPRPRNADTSPNQGVELDTKIFSISPTLKFVYAGYILAILAAFLVVALLSILFTTLPTIYAVIAGLLFLLIPVYFHIRQKLVQYKLTDTTIEIDKGLISRTTQNIPLRRIQDVTVSATIMQRILGFGDIKIDNAGEEGGTVVLGNVDSPRKYADLLLRQMQRLDK